MRLLFGLRSAYSTDRFKLLRVYRNYTNIQLVNALMVNRAAAWPWLVANSMRLYRIACRVLGRNFTNSVVENTFGKVFTAGKTLDEVAEMSKQFQQENIPVIIDYCGEGFVDEACVESELDFNAEMFRLTAQETAKHPNQMISIKISGLVDMKVLRKLNNGALLISKFWERNAKEGVLTGEGMLLGFQEVYGGVTEDDVSRFLKLVFAYEGALQEFRCDAVDFKMKVHPSYIDSSEKNDNNLINLFCPLSKEELTLVGNMMRRISHILEPFAKNSNNFRIIIDAEQSYIQSAIFSLSEQYQIKYNRERHYIVPTLQNYIRTAPQRIHYELELARRNNLVFCVKFVRGAYLVEEKRIADANGTQCPVVDSFEQTTKNFLGNVQEVLQAKDLKQGSLLIIGTHNQETIEEVKIMSEKQPNPNATVEYAQLLGLADHLTIQLKRQGYPVYKYLPYGPTSTMVPYLIRRAQQLSQMKYPLTLQYDLIKAQLRQRLGLNS